MTRVIQDGCGARGIPRMGEMRGLNVNIPDDLYKRIKVRIAELYDGGHKGDLQRVVAEALELWLQHPTSTKRGKHE